MGRYGNNMCLSSMSNSLRIAKALSEQHIYCHFRGIVTGQFSPSGLTSDVGRNIAHAITTSVQF